MIKLERTQVIEQVNTDRLSSGQVLPYSRSLQPGCVLMTSHRSGQKSSGRGALGPQLVLQPELRVQEREDTASSCPYGFFRISLPNYSLKTVTWKVNLPFQGVCLLPPLPYTWQLSAQERTEQSNKTLPSRLPYRGWKSKGQGASGGNKFISLPWPCSHIPVREEDEKSLSRWLPGMRGPQADRCAECEDEFSKAFLMPCLGQGKEGWDHPGQLIASKAARVTGF